MTWYHQMNWHKCYDDNPVDSSSSITLFRKGIQETFTKLCLDIVTELTQHHKQPRNEAHFGYYFNRGGIRTSQLIVVCWQYSFPDSKHRKQLYKPTLTAGGGRYTEEEDRTQSGKVKIVSLRHSSRTHVKVNKRGVGCSFSTIRGCFLN